MSDYDDVVNSLRLIMSGVRYVNFRQATTGKLNVDGTLNLDATAGLPDGYIWVRFGEDRSAAVVKNMTMRNVAGVYVEVVYDTYHQEDQVWEVDRVRALEAMGAAAAAAMNVPEQGASISTPISARDVTFLNLFPDSELGGLVVRITAGMLPGGMWWDGASTTTLTPTSSGGKKSLVCVGIDPIALTYVKTLAADRTFGEDLIADRELTEDGATDVKAVMDADPATVWIGAVELANGDTTIDASLVTSLFWRLPTMTAATSGAAGVAGLAPAPAAGDEGKFLRGDATWVSISGGAATTLTLASGAVTGTNTDAYFKIAAQSGTADDLDTLTLTGTPRLVLLQADTGDTITVKHSMGNIELNGAVDFELSGDKTLALFWDGTNLADVGAGGGSGGGSGGGLESFQMSTVLYDGTLGSAGTLSSGTIALTGYDYVKILIYNARATASVTAADIRLALNSDTTDANYRRINHDFGTGSTHGISTANDRLIGRVPGASATANFISSIEITIYDPAGSNKKAARGVSLEARDLSNTFERDSHVTWNNTAAITSISIDVSNATTTFATGTRMQIIGVKLQSVLTGAYYQTAQVNGSALTQRGKFNFLSGTGITVSGADDSGNDESEIAVALNINGLTTETTIDNAADYLPFYDASESAPNKVTPNALMASPPAIGGTTPAAGTFDALRANGDLTLAGAPGKIKPASDSTTALRITNAAGDFFVTFDTTNKKFIVGDAPSYGTDYNFIIKGTAAANNAAVFLEHYNTGYARWVFANSNGNFTVTQDTVGTPLTIYAGTAGGMMVLQNNSVGIFDTPSSTQLQVKTTDPDKYIVRLMTHASQVYDILRAVDPSGNVLAAVGPKGAGTFAPRDTATNAITAALTLAHNTSGTPAAGYGASFNFQLESSTTENVEVGRDVASWSTATHASRAVDRTQYLTDSGGEREFVRYRATGSAAQIGWLGTTPRGQVTLPADATDLATVIALANALKAMFSAAAGGFGLAA